MTLFITSIQTARLAFLLVPMLAITTVMHFPMFMPIKMGMAVAKRMEPVDDIACKTPTEAEELCKTAVTAMPISTPSRGLENMVIHSLNAAESARGRMACSMETMPTNKMPKPVIIIAILRVFTFFDTSIIPAPTAIQTGANEAGFRRSISRLVSWISPKRKICAVIVVPMFAPMITGIA